VHPRHKSCGAFAYGIYWQIKSLFQLRKVITRY